MGFSGVTENGVNFNQSTNDYAWKIIYSGSNIITLNKFSGITGTQHEVFMANDFKDIISHITANTLNYNSIIIIIWIMI